LGVVHKSMPTIVSPPSKIPPQLSSSATFPTASRNSKAFRNLQEQREQLPIARGGIITNLHNIDKASEFLPFPLLGRESLVRSIALNDVTIILGETGSGKTTRLSQLSPSQAIWLMFSY
jgi:HrpA-like RNA helicase